MTEWFRMLSAARAQLGLDQATLAARAHISLPSLKAYETGRRHPSRPYLNAILDALNVDGGTRKAILEGAGFAAPATLFPREDYPEYFFSLDELQQEVELAPWPEFVLNSSSEIVAANAAVQALWGIDFKQELAARKTPQLNLLSVASQRRFTDRMLNWDECIATLVAVFKGRRVNQLSLDNPDPYFYKVLEEFASGDPAFLARLVHVWTSTAGREAKVRWNYRVAWRDEEYGDMQFHGIVGTASEPDGLGFNDWYPADGASWAVLEQVKRRAAPTLPS